MSLASRLLLVLLVPAALCFVAFGTNTVHLRRHLMTAEATRELRDHGTALQVALDALLRDRNLDDIAELTTGLTRAERLQGVLIFDHDGRLLDVSRAVVPADAAFAALARRVRADRQPRAETRAVAGRVLQAYAFPIGRAPAAPPRATAVVLRDLAYVEANVADFAREIMLIGLVVMAVVALGTWLATRWAVIRPIGALLGGVERVAAGDLSAEIAGARRDELGRLARAFNGMTASLRHARDELARESDANRALERRLQHAQRLALIGQLAASIAHQVGSPFNVILGRARYALKQGGQSERDARHLQEIVAGAEGISRVVERLLSQARRARGPAGDVDLAEVARDTARFLEAECERAGVAASVEVERGVRVEGSRDELGQLVLNLCVNALQVQPRGGRLAITVRRAADATNAELSVADAGPGVPPELRERIFEAFYTTKPAGEGTGLGLAICDEIVRRQGGTIVVSDAPGGGALFRVTLPLLRSSGAKRSAGAPERRQT